MMKKLSGVWFAAVIAAVAGSLFLSGCKSDGKPQQGATDPQLAAEGATPEAVSKPLTKFDGVDFVEIYDASPAR